MTSWLNLKHSLQHWQYLLYVVNLKLGERFSIRPSATSFLGRISESPSVCLSLCWAFQGAVNRKGPLGRAVTMLCKLMPI